MRIVDESMTWMRLSRWEAIASRLEAITTSSYLLQKQMPEFSRSMSLFLDS